MEVRLLQDLNQVAPQRTLRDKYEKIRESGEIMKQLSQIAVA